MGDISAAFEALFRWMHVFAGILWIGHLYFFNFVNGQFEGKLDGGTKKTVIPELRPYRRRGEIGEKLVHGRHILGGLVFELVGRVVRVAEQGSAYGRDHRDDCGDLPGCFTLRFAV